RMAELLEDPESALAEIQDLALRVRMHETLGLSAMSNWAAYYGDPRHAIALLRRMDRSGLNGTVLLLDMWRPTLATARRLPEFKELVRDLGLVEYWRAYGWSDHCRPVGANDFDCEERDGTSARAGPRDDRGEFRRRHAGPPPARLRRAIRAAAENSRRKAASSEPACPAVHKTSRHGHGG